MATSDRSKEPLSERLPFNAAHQAFAWRRPDKMWEWSRASAIVLITLPAICQSPSPVPKYQSGTPHLVLHFHEVGGSWALPSDVLVGAQHCNGSELVLRFANRPMYERDSVAVVSSEKAPIVLPYEHIANLTGTYIKSVDTLDGEVILLVKARSADEFPEMSRLSPVQAPDRKGRYSADYLTIFSLDGVYKRSIPLESPFDPVRFAALSTDRFLVLGMEHTSAQPVVGLFDGDGQFLRYLDAPLPPIERLEKDLQRSSKRDFPSTADTDQVYSALSGYELVHSGKNLLLFKPRTGSEVIEISPSGQMRSVRLTLPANIQLDTILGSSGDSWMVRGVTGTVATPYFLEFNPVDGSLIRQIDTGSVPTTSLMCVEGGKFYGLHSDNEKSRVLEGTP